MRTRMHGASNTERFDAKYTTVPESGCWLWTAYINDGGYGLFDMPGHRGAKAHRVSFEMANGPIPAGMMVCHKCDTRSCVNPAHLFLGSQKDNVQDMLGKGRGAEQKKTHCKQGHELTGANLRKDSAARGWRGCVTCEKERRRRGREERNRKPESADNNLWQSVIGVPRGGCNLLPRESGHISGAEE